MSGLFNTFNVAKRGMQAQQTSLHVVSHNIANANTEGYSVQRANLKTTTPFGMPSLTTSAEPGQIGTGVKVDSITRSRDEFLDFYIRKETSTLENYKAREQFLSQIETVFTEPSDTGIGTLLTRFWDAWQGLATNPESSTSRELVRSNALALCEGVRHNYTQLEDIESSVSDLMQNQVFEVSSMLKQIADLNEQIKAVTIGGKNPNDLMDRRDLLLDKISERLSIKTKPTDYNGIELYGYEEYTDENGMTKTREVKLITDTKIEKVMYFISDAVITDQNNNTINKKDFPKTINFPITVKFKGYINGDFNNQFESQEVTINDSKELQNYFQVDKDNPNKILNIMPHIFYGTGENKNPNVNLEGESGIKPVKFANGSFKGLEALSDEINKYKNQLNKLAKGIAIAVNTIHNDGSNNEGVPFGNFFDNVAEISDVPAKNLKLVADIENGKLDKINAGKAGSKAGNGERALLIGQLRNTRFNITQLNDRNDFIGSLKGVNLDLTNLKMTSNASGATLEGYYKGTISELGVSNQEAKRMVKNQENLVDQLVIRRESVSGVSIDEEMTNMLQFQRAYEANAKMISVIDQLLDVVVNGLLRR